MMKNIMKIVGALVLVVISIAASVSGTQTGIPSMGNIGDQVVGCNQQFPQINLNAITEHPVYDDSELEFTYYDNLDFEVSINNGIATVHNPGISRTEWIGFRVIDPDGNTAMTKAEFSSKGCFEEAVREDYEHPPLPTPDIPPYTGDIPPGIVPPGHGGVYPIPGVGFGGVDIFIPGGVGQAPPHTCAISTGHGLLNDMDCDDVPDPADNCPTIPNPRQADQNRNGIGDACDLVVADMTVQPDKLSCKRSVVATSVVANNHDAPFSNVKATLAIPELGIEEVQYIKVMQPGSSAEVELTSRIPISAEPGSYNLIVELEYFVGSHTERTGAAQKIRVTGESCGMESPDDSFVEVQEIQDVKPGHKAVFPIKIENTENRANSYTFAVKDVSDFGTYSIDPGSLIIIDAESEGTVYLNVMADEDVKEGEKTFVFEVRKGNEVEQVVLVANILPIEEEASYMSWIVTAVFMVALFFIVLAALTSKEWRTTMNTRGQKALTKQELMIPEQTGDRRKVAWLGIQKEKGWLYYVDKEGDVSRSKMKWLKDKEAEEAN